MVETTSNKSGKSFVEDGAICPKLFTRDPWRIVHLLKEPTKGNESLAQVIKDKAIVNGRVKGPLFKVTARRSYCIQKGFPSWVEIQRNENLFGDALKRSAIVNLSPQPGETSTSAKSLEQLANRWKHRCYGEKLKELEPKIVICGGTFSVLNQTLDVDCEMVQTALTGMQYFVDPVLGAAFLDCWHPSFRGKHSVEYCYFCESCKDIIGKLRL